MPGLTRIANDFARTVGLISGQPRGASSPMDAEHARCNTALRVARNSSCPSHRWLDSVAPLLLDGTEPIVMFNAGANKGFQVAEFLQRFHAMDGSGWHTNQAWHDRQAGQVTRRLHPCGPCDSCSVPPPAERFNRPVRVFAFDLAPRNVELLNKTFAALSVPGEVALAVVSNRSGVAWGPRNAARIQSGDEGQSALMRRKAGRWDTPTRAVSVDSFAAERGLERVHILAVDTEGFDALVIEGAAALLARHQIDILEFEYHGIGYWHARFEERRTLRTTLAALDKHGYVCYWQAATGQLARASGAAWCPRFEFRRWSNLVCAARPEITRRLDALANVS